MRWLANIRLRVRSLFRRRTVDEELNEELRFHLDRAIEQNIARGMTPEEARRQALIELGGAEQVKEECRDARGIKFLQELLQDMRYGLRLLRKSPGFAITAIVTLALGIGVNVSMLGVVDALLFRLPAHVRAPGELVRVEFGVGNRSQFVDFGTYPQYEQLSQSVHLLDLAAVGPNMKVTLGRGLEARQIHGAYVSHTYFHVLGAHMLLGRAFNAAEDHRLRAHFPSGLPAGVSKADQHFGVIQRPVALPRWDPATWMEQPLGTYPQKAFVSVDDGALPGLQRIGFVRSVRTPQFNGITFHEVLCKSALNKVPDARPNVAGSRSRGERLEKELQSSFRRRFREHVVEAGGVGGAQSGRVGVVREADDRDVRIGVRHLVRVDARDVHEHEVRVLGVVHRDETMPW